MRSLSPSANGQMRSHCWHKHIHNGCLVCHCHFNSPDCGSFSSGSGGNAAIASLGTACGTKHANELLALACGEPLSLASPSACVTLSCLPQLRKMLIQNPFPPRAVSQNFGFGAMCFAPLCQCHMSRFPLTASDFSLQACTSWAEASLTECQLC